MKNKSGSQDVESNKKLISEEILKLANDLEARVEKSRPTIRYVNPDFKPNRNEDSAPYLLDTEFHSSLLGWSQNG